MPEDTALMDEVEEKENLLKDFSFDNYAVLVPTELRDGLETVFTKQIYGWKRKARIILRLESAHAHVSSIEDELRDACEGRTTARQPRSKEDIARTSIRNYLNNLDNDKLEMLCNKHSVSFTSFMASND